MSVSIDRISGSGHSRFREIGVVLVIIFAGPLVGLGLAAFDLVLAPPQTFLTSLIYISLACLGLPLWTLATRLRWIRIGIRGALVTLAVAGMVTCVYLTLIGPGLPSGWIDCQTTPSTLPEIRYTCVSTSSDTGHQYEFVLEGRAGWPVMRMVRPNP
jgi:hypothetical protein